jgi:hypothetical protein
VTSIAFRSDGSFSTEGTLQFTIQRAASFRHYLSSESLPQRANRCAFHTCARELLNNRLGVREAKHGPQLLGPQLLVLRRQQSNVALRIRPKQ